MREQLLFATRILKSTLEPRLSFSPGTRVRVEGLQNQLQYNGLEGVVLKEESDSHVRICLDQGNMVLHLKMQNVHPLLVTEELLQGLTQQQITSVKELSLIAMEDARKEMYIQLQDLTHERITSMKECLRIQVKVKGIKHVNTACAHHNLGLASMRTYKPDETRELVAMMNKAIMNQVAADGDLTRRAKRLP